MSDEATLKEVKEARQKLANDILALVIDFINEYNVKVGEIRLWGDVMGSYAPQRCDVEIEL